MSTGSLDIELCMTTIGLIGSGNIGGTLARLAVDAGHDVVLSNSRGPGTLAGLVAELGPQASAGTTVEAATAGEIVIVTIPLKAISAVPVQPLAGKVVLDTNNYYPERDGQIAVLDAKEQTTSGLLQEHLPTSAVVKVFNNIFFKHLLTLSRPAGADDRSVLPIAGDSAEAKATASAFLDSIGFGAFDTGSLADSWRFERDTPAYGLFVEDGDWDHPVPATPDKLATLLAAAQR
jgi:predicted dinucleotide-binding enzyme